MNENNSHHLKRDGKYFLHDKCTTSNMQSEDEKNFFQFMENIS